MYFGPRTKDAEIQIASQISEPRNSLDDYLLFPVSTWGQHKIQEENGAPFSSGDDRRGKANYWQSPDNSLSFNANDDKANFDNRGNLSNANDNYSGGLLFVG